MNKKVLWSSLIRSNLFLLVAILAGCKPSSPPDPWVGFQPFDDAISSINAYHEATLGEKVHPREGVSRVFVDFSNGLIAAYQNPNNAAIMNALAQKLVDADKTTAWYGLGQKEFKGIGKLEFTDARSLYNKVTDPKSYKDVMAPLEETLKRIVGAKNDALLITDFEEYTPDGNEQLYAYAKSYFTQWLKGGNSITLYYTPYQESNLSLSSTKNLYFAVFSFGKDSNRDKGGIKSEIEKALEGRGLQYKTFELDPSPYRLQNNYGGNDRSGLKNKVLIQNTSIFFNGLEKTQKPYEIIGLIPPFNENLADMVEQISIQQQDRLFLQGLQLDASRQQAYQLKKVRVAVQDITTDFEHYARCQEAQMNHVPTFMRNDKKEQIWDTKSQKDPIIEECYVHNTDSLKPTYRYTSPGSVDTWEEVLDLDEDIFLGHLKNDPAKIETRVVFHKNYSPDKIKNPNALLRIDLLIEQSDPNLGNPQLNDFKWVSLIKKENGENASLYESIRSTLQDVRPSSILYSYYVKFGLPKKTQQ